MKVQTIDGPVDIEVTIIDDRPAIEIQDNQRDVGALIALTPKQALVLGNTLRQTVFEGTATGLKTIATKAGY